ncbi:hypothetical protein [Flavobacterium sp.]|uniref:hypothetical protein n=1 Tax=Flavobacterium sp. TaxID=239 RepID=UPI00260AC274|nr:hypothetical protein [Flavobacterium sp.]MDG2432894.1 hypothetical protein [Flavobacterium sp.]
MKKRLEADLVSIAHRILQLKNKSDINVLYAETQKLYEKLAVLKFVEEQYGTTKPTISLTEIEKDIEAFYDKEESLPVETVIEMTEEIPAPAKEEPSNAIEETIEIPVAETTAEFSTDEKIEVPAVDKDPELGKFEADIREESVAVIEEEHEEEVTADNEDAEEEIATLLEEEKSTTEFEPAFTAAFELTEEETEEEEIEAPKPAAVQISFADLLGGNYNEPQFVKVDDVAPLPVETIFEPVINEPIAIDRTVTEVEKPASPTPPKIVSLNDKLSKGLDIDLNDRIAFVKHLFGNNDEDYNRVLNQLITFDNFYETKNFIDEMVKPDYNNWEGKENYEERFMDIIEKKFL